MSSDSDEDIGLRLQKMTNKYQEDKIENTALLNESNEIDEIFERMPQNDRESSPLDLNDLPGPSVSKTPDELPEVELSSRPKRVTRSSARKRNTAETLTEELPLSSRKRSKKATATANNTVNNTSSISTPASSSRSRGRRGRSNRGSWRQTSPARGRRRNLWAMAQLMAQMIPACTSHTHVIGDAEDVADASRGQALFSNQKNTDEVMEVEEINEINDSLDDNEELSVKVHWQSYKYEIFKIRRYQKLTQIFDYFADKENVGYDKLLFMYNDKIIKPTDTPDSINYNIAKKIEGGTLENSIAPIMSSKEEIKDGIKIKFQCQHLKKPFEIAIRPDDKFSVAMMKCAEHLEKRVNMLRFEFDGDVISGKSTARDLELEGGECIDVKVAS